MTMPGPSRWRQVLAAALLVVPAACLGGCGWIQTILGMESGYLLTAQDVLALPGEHVLLRARLEAGSFLRDAPGRTVVFSLSDGTRRSVVTDDEGWAEADFGPLARGDYAFTVSVEPTVLKAAPSPAQLVVACRRPDDPIVVLDLDWTLVGSDFREVLKGDPPPVPGAQEGVGRIAQRWTVVYLTRRLDVLGPKSKRWLAEHGFPLGPVLLADPKSVLKGNRRYKSQQLQRLRERFTGIQFGIGDKRSDVRAYHDSGLHAVLLLRLDEPDNPGHIRRQARALQDLPEGVQVVRDWQQVAAAVLDGQSFPPSRAQEELLRLADEIESRRRGQ